MYSLLKNKNTKSMVNIHFVKFPKCSCHGQTVYDNNNIIIIIIYLNQTIACKCRCISGGHFSSPLFFGGEKRQPEICLRSQANNNDLIQDVLTAQQMGFITKAGLGSRVRGIKELPHPPSYSQR